MVMSSNIFGQYYVDGRSLLRYLPLFNIMNGALNHAACLGRFKPTPSEQRRKTEE
jgi:hypothetical protein